MAFAFITTTEIGRVERCGSTWVGTTFLIFNLLPIFPLRSTLHRSDGSTKQVPLQLGSVALAYARVYPLVVVAVALALHRTPAGYGTAIFAGLCSLVAFRLGRLSSEERAKRWLTAEVVGDPVDLMYIREELPALRAKLDETWSSRAATLAGKGYRTQPTLDDVVQSDDAGLLRTAFAICRIEDALGTGREERTRAIWARMVELGVVDTELDMARTERRTSLAG